MSGAGWQFGAVARNGVTRFRLWAPAPVDVALEVEGHEAVPMPLGTDGWREVEIACGPGARYRYRCGRERVPDPAARQQDDGIRGASIVTDPASYRWRCRDWRGRPWEETVLYELHVGLHGGFRGVAAVLPALVELGITAVELMPIAEFPGARNWGYDGVLPFAPASAYGTPDELKALIDRAHELGLMMFLDVVYNHFGPDGNYLALYAPQFFRNDRTTPWGAAIDIDRAPVCRFFTENALYWLDEFRFDGLRFDAVHAFSSTEWLDAMAIELRARIGTERQIHLVLENEDNDAAHLRGFFDAQWNDDIHHVLHVLLTGEDDGYYRDYAVRPAEALARALRDGFVFQGEPSRTRQGRPRGTPSSDLPPTSFVAFLQNHDQIGNRAFGERLTVLADEAVLRAAAALLLLAPQIPLLFMGEPMGTRAPFLFFTDHNPELAAIVRDGRRREFSAFTAHGAAEIPDPNAPATFERSRPEPSPPGTERWRALYRDLLTLRHKLIVPSLRGTRAVAARALGGAAVKASWRLGNGAILTIATNLADEEVRCDGLPAPPPIWGVASDGQVPARSTIAWITS